MPDEYAPPTLILAALAAAASVVSIVVIFVTRHRDRVELEVVAFEDHGDRIHIKVRNRGGTPTRIAGLFYAGEGGNLLPAAGGYPALAGRTTVTIRYELAGLKRQRRVGNAVYVLDDAGRVSKPLPIPEAIRERLTAE